MSLCITVTNCNPDHYSIYIQLLSNVCWHCFSNSANALRNASGSEAITNRGACALAAVTIVTEVACAAICRALAEASGRG